MAAVTICSDFGAQKNSLTLFPLFPHLFPMKWWDRMPWSSFSECWASVQLFPLSSFTFIKRLFSSSLSVIRVVSYFSQQSWFQLVFHPAWHFAFYSDYKLNKQGDNIQSWRTPFPSWNQSVVPCPVTTAASWPAYRFLRKQVRCSAIPIS